MPKNREPGLSSKPEFSRASIPRDRTIRDNLFIRRTVFGGRFRASCLSGRMPLHVFPRDKAFSVSAINPAPETSDLPAMAKGKSGISSLSFTDLRGVPMTTAALFPPKPKEFERTVRISFISDALTGCMLRTGSGTVQPVLGGTMPVVYGHHGNNGLHDACRRKGVTHGAFDGRMARKPVSKQLVYRCRFRSVIVDGSCSVQVDIVYIQRGDARIRHGGSHGLQGSSAIGMGGCGMKRIAAQTGAHDFGQGILGRMVRPHEGRRPRRPRRPSFPFCSDQTVLLHRGLSTGAI